MAYPGVDWQNKPSKASPINRTNLEIMDNGIIDAHEKVENVDVLALDTANNYLYSEYPVSFESGIYTANFEPQANAEYMRSNKILYAVKPVRIKFMSSKYWVNISYVDSFLEPSRTSSEWKYSSFDVEAGTYFWLHVRGTTAHTLTAEEQAEIQATTSVENINALVPQIDEDSNNLWFALSPMSFVSNIANPADKVSGKYYSSSGALVDAENWYALKVKVEPSTKYTIFKIFETYSFFATEAGSVISKITRTNNVCTTPANCKYLLLSNTLVNDTAIVIKGEGYIDENQAYHVPIKTKVEALDFSDVVVTAEDVTINNPIICKSFETSLWGYGSVEKLNDGSIKYNPSIPSNGGFKTKNIPEVTNNLLLVKTKVSQLNGTVRIFIFGKKSSGTDLTSVVGEFNTTGEKEWVIDLAYFAIYRELDVSKPFSIGFVLIGNTSDGSAVIYDNFNVYDYIYTEFDEGESVAKALEDTNAKAEQAYVTASSISLSSLPLTGDDGKKYLLQLSNGVVTAYPIIPENVLFMGNSLLFGWGTFGMAASNNQEDYYALVTDYLNEHADNPTFQKLYSSSWERAESIQAQETWCEENLLPVLSNNTNLVIIQLGDNVNENTSLAFFEQASLNLVSYIREHAPNARVAWVAEWYSSNEKQTYIANACSRYGAVMVDISDLYQVRENRASIGDVITMPDETTRTITDAAVASHPSSTGMAKIAQRIIQRLFE